MTGFPEHSVDSTTFYVLQKLTTQPWGPDWTDRQQWPLSEGDAALRAWTDNTIRELGQWKLIARRIETHERTVRDHAQPDPVPEAPKGFKGAEVTFLAVDEAVDTPPPSQAGRLLQANRLRRMERLSKVLRGVELDGS